MHAGRCPLRRRTRLLEGAMRVHEEDPCDTGRQTETQSDEADDFDVDEFASDALDAE